MADGEETACWPIEHIPDENTLFLRIHKGNTDGNGNVLTRALSPQPKGAVGLSTNWDKYSSAVLTRIEVQKILHPKSHQPKNPSDFGVISLLVGKVREITELSVEHVPVMTPFANRAHSEIYGANTEDTEARVKLSRVCEWCIRVEEPVRS